MRVLFQGLQIADAIVTCAGFEGVAKHERAQRRVTPGAAAIDHQAIAIDFAARRQKLRAVAAIIHINNTPRAVQAFAVGAAIAGAAAIIHVKHGDAPAGPVLNAQRQSGDRCRSRAAVTLDQQRRFFVSGRGKVAVLRWIEKAVRGQSAFGWELNRLRRRQVTGINCEAARALQDFRLARRQIHRDDCERFQRRAGAKHCATRRRAHERNLGIRSFDPLELSRARVDHPEAPNALLRKSAHDSIGGFKRVG